jgi:hypothetical protein
MPQYGGLTHDPDSPQFLRLAVEPFHDLRNILEVRFVWTRQGSGESSRMREVYGRARPGPLQPSKDQERR